MSEPVRIQGSFTSKYLLTYTNFVTVTLWSLSCGYDPTKLCSWRFGICAEGGWSTNRTGNNNRSAILLFAPAKLTYGFLSFISSSPQVPPPKSTPPRHTTDYRSGNPWEGKKGGGGESSFDCWSPSVVTYQGVPLRPSYLLIMSSTEW